MCRAMCAIWSRVWLYMRSDCSVSSERASGALPANASGERRASAPTTSGALSLSLFSLCHPSTLFVVAQRTHPPIPSVQSPVRSPPPCCASRKSAAETKKNRKQQNHTLSLAPLPPFLAHTHARTHAHTCRGASHRSPLLPARPAPLFGAEKAEEAKRH